MLRVLRNKFYNTCPSTLDRFCAKDSNYISAKHLPSVILSGCKVPRITKWFPSHVINPQVKLNFFDNHFYLQCHPIFIVTTSKKILLNSALLCTSYSSKADETKKTLGLILLWLAGWYPRGVCPFWREMGEEWIRGPGEGLGGEEGRETEIGVW